MRDDLPTFERPMSAISGSAGGGSVETEAWLATRLASNFIFALEHNWLNQDATAAIYPLHPPAERLRQPTDHCPVIQLSRCNITLHPIHLTRLPCQLMTRRLQQCWSHMVEVSRSRPYHPATQSSHHS